MGEIKLTQYSHGAGCGCKISPKILAEILGERSSSEIDPRLMVGNSTSDDAAVFDNGNGEAIISTTDFFMPIVDDPKDFGRIASVNAMSDVYAMGGTPIMAIAILGWPVDKLPAIHASSVLNGAKEVCHNAGIALAGGHSIDCPEPIFGLAVTGTAKIQNIKRNSMAKVGSSLYLTKRLGVGIVTTAQKKGIVSHEHLEEAKRSMLILNDVGTKLGGMPFVNSMTDVTGFGFLGHLNEICTNSQLSAEIDFSMIPQFDFLDPYLDLKCFPGGTKRNWDSYGNDVSIEAERQKLILADPQTSGGLLISVDQGAEKEFEEELKESGFDMLSFGKMTSLTDQHIRVYDSPAA